MCAGGKRRVITVAFVHVGEEDLLPRIMVASVRRAMPSGRIVHLADQKTRPVDGADDVIRLPYDGVHLMTFRLLQFARLDPCEAIFLDTDVIVQRDLSPLFESDFDVALTRRENIGVDPQGVDVAAVMPYNTGVMLSRPSGWDFWHNALKYCETLPEEARRWWGDQFAIKAVAEIAPLRIEELPCDLYNYSPALDTEDVSRRFVVHYKGMRKPWMIRRAKLELGLKA
jgi:hypothetical protein